MLTSWIEIRHKVDVEISKLISKGVFNARRNWTEEQGQFGGVEYWVKDVSGCIIIVPISEILKVRHTHLREWDHFRG